MTRSDLTFVLSGRSLTEVRDALAAMVGVRFEMRSSFYCCGDYFRAIWDETEFRIQSNWDGDELAEQEFSPSDVLILVDGAKDPTAWKEMLANLRAVVIRVATYDI